MLTLNRGVLFYTILVITLTLYLSPSLYGKPIQPPENQFLYILNYLFQNGAQLFVLPTLLINWRSIYAIARYLTMIVVWLLTTFLYFSVVKQNWKICLDEKVTKSCTNHQAVDLSGHCFLTSVILFYSLAEIRLLMKKSNFTSRFLIGYLLTINIFFFVNMIRTVSYYHNALESSVAILLAYCYYLIVYAYLGLGKK